MEKYMFRIPSPMLTRLRQLSKRTRVPVSELIRMGIDVILRRKKWQ